VDLYSALDDKHLVLKALKHGSHSLTCKQRHVCLFRVHHVAPPQTVVTTSICSLSTRKDERLSWPSWLTYSRRFTHISGHPSAVIKVERRTAKARRSKTSVLSRCATEPTVCRVGVSTYSRGLRICSHFAEKMAEDILTKLGKQLPHRGP